MKNQYWRQYTWWYLDYTGTIAFSSLRDLRTPTSRLEPGTPRTESNALTTILSRALILLRARAKCCRTSAGAGEEYCRSLLPCNQTGQQSSRCRSGLIAWHRVQDELE
eukprot:6213628-Pleurochrysis_carterae.AAC.1